MIHCLRLARAASAILSCDAEDRRLYHRFSPHGLMVRLGRNLVDIHDLSIGGMSVARNGLAMGSAVSLQLIPRKGRSLLLPQAIVANGEVIGECASWTRLRFTSMNFNLAKFLVRHLALQNGLAPHMVK